MFPYIAYMDPMGNSFSKDNTWLNLLKDVTLRPSVVLP